MYCRLGNHRARCSHFGVMICPLIQSLSDSRSARCTACIVVGVVVAIVALWISMVMRVVGYLGPGGGHSDCRGGEGDGGCGGLDM